MEEEEDEPPALLLEEVADAYLKTYFEYRQFVCFTGLLKCCRNRGKFTMGKKIKKKWKITREHSNAFVLLETAISDNFRLKWNICYQKQRPTVGSAYCWEA